MHQAAFSSQLLNQSWLIRIDQTDHFVYRPVISDNPLATIPFVIGKYYGIQEMSSVFSFEAIFRGN